MPPPNLLAGAAGRKQEQASGSTAAAGHSSRVPAAPGAGHGTTSASVVGESRSPRKAVAAALPLGQAANANAAADGAAKAEMQAEDPSNIVVALHGTHKQAAAAPTGPSKRGRRDRPDAGQQGGVQQPRPARPKRRSPFMGAAAARDRGDAALTRGQSDGGGAHGMHACAPAGLTDGVTTRLRQARAGHQSGAGKGAGPAGAAEGKSKRRVVKKGAGGGKTARRLKGAPGEPSKQEKQRQERQQGELRRSTRARKGAAAT